MYTEIALHSLVSLIEKSISYTKYTLAVLIVIEGAFCNVKPLTISEELSDPDVEESFL